MNLDITLPAGIPLKKDYHSLVEGEFFRDMELYSDIFLKEFNFLKKEYRWVQDPFHQWSRQWEYPFVYSALLPRKKKDAGTDFSVLDAGSGVTFFPFYIKERIKESVVHCCDRESHIATLFEKINRQRPPSQAVAFKASELTNLPYDNESFDVVYCISVLEHTKNYAEIIHELSRVLKKDGTLILSIDIGLDGVSDISPIEAEAIISILDAQFVTGSKSQEKRLSLTNDIITSSYISSFDKKLAPWRHPVISLIKSAIKSRRWPTVATKNITVYCDAFKKPRR